MFLEVIRMCSYVLWALAEGDRLRIGASVARYSPIPFGAQAITLVEGCDLSIMRRWCERHAKRGWSVEKMRRACEG